MEVSDSYRMDDLLDTGEKTLNTPPPTEQLEDSTGGPSSAIAKLIRSCIDPKTGQTTGRSTRSSRVLCRERVYAALLGVLGVIFLFVAACMLFALLWMTADATPSGSVDGHYSNGTNRNRKTSIRRCSTNTSKCTKGANFIVV